MVTFKQGVRGQNSQAVGSAELGRDSVVVGRDQVLQWALDGRLFHAQQGDAATKVDFVELAYDEDQPQFALRVPSGVMMVPLYFAITIEDLPQVDLHVVWSTTANDIGNGTSSPLTVTKMRTDGDKEPSCIARSLYTGNADVAINLIEVKRWYRPFASADVEDGWKPEDYLWSWKDGPYSYLVGPATVQMHAFSGTDGPQGFGEYVWAEFPLGQHPI